MGKDNQTTTDPWGCDEEFTDAPFCKGDSVIECWDKSQVPQGELCPSNPCEAEGTCDHTDPVPGTDCEVGQRSARGYCPGEEGHEAEREATHEGGVSDEAEAETATTSEQVTTAPEPAAELPHTGPVTDLFLLGALGVSLLASGIGVLRRT